MNNANTLKTEITFSISSKDPNISTLDIYEEIYQSLQKLQDRLLSKYSVQGIELLQDPTFPVTTEKLVATFMIAFATSAGLHLGTETAKGTQELIKEELTPERIEQVKLKMDEATQDVSDWLENNWSDVRFKKLNQIN